MMLRNLFRRRFSSTDNMMAKLMYKVPKEVENDKSSGFLSSLFEQTKKSPTYLLQKELFVYLKTSPLLEQQFPFIKSDDRFQQNWMILHLQILKSRLVQISPIQIEEKERSDAINQMELQKFDYNAQTYFFGDYSSHIHPQMPVGSFRGHFAQSYLKKLRVFQEDFTVNYEQRPTQEILANLLRKLIFQNRVGYKDVELLKLSKYYIAHRRYLAMLDWQSLLLSKVKWGFEEQRNLLTHLSSEKI